MNNAPKIKYTRGGSNMHKTKAIFYETLESKLNNEIATGPSVTELALA